MTHRILATKIAGPLMALGFAYSASAQPTGATVSLERSGCFGTCPSYIVTIHQNGLVEYEGRRFVKATGRRTRRIPKAAADRLFAEFETAHFFDLKPSYRSSITDQATYVLTLSRGGGVHSVEDYAGVTVGMPPVVKDLERAVDVTAGTDEWIGRKPNG
jgi:hypothetical protein